GNMPLEYGYSNLNDYPTVAVTEHAVTDGINFLETPQILASGNEVSNSGRYGDYFGAGVDPANTTRVWIAGEYMNSNAGLCGSTNCYSTQIAELTTTGFTSSSDLSTLTLQRGSSGTSLITLS